ncbi:MAG: Spy/CpxP family protein refolding chaperone [Pyrinomonadaceae bacterium]
MSLKRRFISFLTVMAGVVILSTVSFAQDDKATTAISPQKIERPNRGGGRKMGEGEFGRKGFGGRHGKMGMRARGFLRGIDLTDAQKSQLRAIREANKPDAATIAELRAIHEARKAGTAITPEQKERLKALREQARTKGLAIREQIQGILTAEQKAQIETKKQEMKQRFQERRQQRELRKNDPAATTTEKPKVG